MTSLITQLTRGVARRLRITRAPERGHPGYRYEPSHTVVRDFAAFADLSIDDVVDRINGNRELCHHDWETLPDAEFSTKVAEFYEASTHYIYDLLSVNYAPEAVTEKLDRFAPGLLERIRTHPGERLLEYGGGTGVFCELAVALGKRVTYLDIPGLPMKFAAWRFEKHALPIEMIEATPGKPHLEHEYDIIFSDAVFEHLPTAEQEAAAVLLAQRTAPGGMLVLLIDLSGESDEMPMHVNVDIVRLHALVEAEGLTCESGRDSFCSIWTRA